MKKRHNYSRRLFWAYSTALLLVLLLLFFFVLFFIYREQYQKNVEMQAQLVSKTQAQLDASLQEMDRIINGLLFDQDFLSIMSDGSAPLHYTDYSRRVIGSFVVLDAPLFSTYRIIAFNRDIYYTMSKTGENQPYIKDAVSTWPWWEEVLAANGQKVILPLHADPFDPSAAPVYTVARAITEAGACHGVVAVENSYERLRQFCSLGAQMGTAAVFSPGGSLVYPNAAEDPGILPPLYERVASEPADSGSFLFRQLQVSYQRSDYSGWLTVIYTPLGDMVPYALELILLSVVAFLMLAGLSLVMLHLLTKRLTAPLLNLDRALSQVSLSNLSLTLPDAHGIAEIETINRSFEEMFRHLKGAIAQSVQSRANEERANFLALQSQMNPHTIYNTIAMIESVSYMHGDREVSNLCICFSQMLRYISDYTKRPYTVKDELQHLGNYAVLIMKRYEGKLDIHARCDDGLERLELPKFTIQPLVENAVKHGFGAACGRLDIAVEVRAVPGGWGVLVEDSGQGFAPERLEEISRQFTHCDECLKASGDVVNQKIGNLALSNIYIRCRLLYGGAFHIALGNRTEGPGCYVELTFLTGEAEPS